MTVTATEKDWLSPEMQMAAVAARQILKVPGSDEHRNTLLGIVGFHQGKERGEGDVYIDTRRNLITDRPGARYPLDQTIQDWTNVVLGQIDARTLINLLRCDMIPSDIELDGLGLSLMDLLLGIHQWGGNTYSSRFGLNHTAYVPVVETILSYYLLEVGAEITDCKAVHDIAEWLSVVRNQGPGTQRFLELVAQL